ncbi:hypothetical protein HAX54_017203, partial [Datura stramonium]|nr:hypothetical protein [Datura stramonium]
LVKEEKPPSLQIMVEEEVVEWGVEEEILEEILKEMFEKYPLEQWRIGRGVSCE